MNEQYFDRAEWESYQALIEHHKLHHEAEAEEAQILDRLKAVAHTAKIIYHVSANNYGTKITHCPHGNAPKYPTHAWWCDNCFNELGKRLEALIPPSAE